MAVRLQGIAAVRCQQGGDKLSVILTLVLAFVFLHEQFQVPDRLRADWDGNAKDGTVKGEITDRTTPWSEEI